MSLEFNMLLGFTFTICGFMVVAVWIAVSNARRAIELEMRIRELNEIPEEIKILNKPVDMPHGDECSCYYCNPQV